METALPIPAQQTTAFVEKNPIMLILLTCALNTRAGVRAAASASSKRRAEGTPTHRITIPTDRKM